MTQDKLSPLTLRKHEVKCYEDEISWHGGVLKIGRLSSTRRYIEV